MEIHQMSNVALVLAVSLLLNLDAKKSLALSTGTTKSKDVRKKKYYYTFFEAKGISVLLLRIPYNSFRYKRESENIINRGNARNRSIPGPNYFPHPFPSSVCAIKPIFGNGHMDDQGGATAVPTKARFHADVHESIAGEHAPTKTKRHASTTEFTQKNTSRHEVNADEDEDKAHHHSTPSIFIPTRSPTATRNSFPKPFGAANPSNTYTFALEHTHIDENRSSPPKEKPPESKVRTSFVLIAAYVAGGYEMVNPSLVRVAKTSFAIQTNKHYRTVYTVI